MDRKEEWKRTSAELDIRCEPLIEEIRAELAGLNAEQAITLLYRLYNKALNTRPITLTCSRKTQPGKTGVLS